jgi:hypothetical protein
VTPRTRKLVTAVEGRLGGAAGPDPKVTRRLARGAGQCGPSAPRSRRTFDEEPAQQLDPFLLRWNDIGCLTCDERGLSLWEDEDPGGELDPLGDRGQVGHHDESVVQWVVLALGPVIGWRSRRRRITAGAINTAG